MLSMMTEKEKSAKALTVCPDCGEVIGTDVALGQTTRCPYCGLWFKFTRKVIRHA
jgi:uncharacterized C2H2 Zn-finger protein